MRRREAGQSETPRASELTSAAPLGRTASTSKTEEVEEEGLAAMHLYHQSEELATWTIYPILRIPAS